MTLDSESVKANEARERGNMSVKMGRFQEAWEHYTQGLSTSPREESMVSLLANRALALLRLDRFEEALSDCERVLAVEPEHKKVVFRRGKALMGLERYAEAADALRLAKTLASGSSEVHEELKRAKIALAQSTQGTFDFRSMLAEAALKETFQLQHSSPLSSFTSNLLEVADVSAKGLGYVAKQFISKGELLVMAKPLVFVPYPELTSGNHNILVQRLLQVAQSNQASACQVRKLCGARKHDQSREEALTVEEACEVLRNNCFTSATGVGLWHAVSFFNHSDAPNAARFCIADWAMVRAKDDICAGTEITLSYIDFSADYSSQAEYLRKLGIVDQVLIDQESQWAHTQDPQLMDLKSGALRDRLLIDAGAEESPLVERRRYLELFGTEKGEFWYWGQYLRWLKEEKAFRKERGEPKRALGAALAIAHLVDSHMGFCAASLEAWADCSALLFELPEEEASGEHHGEAMEVCVESMQICIDFAFGEDWADDTDFSTLVLEWATLRWYHAAAWERQTSLPSTQDSAPTLEQAEPAEQLDCMD